jgi:hypothetical protein
MSVNQGYLEILTWKDIRETVLTINPVFAKVVDKLDPSDDYKLVKVKYPYGSLVLKDAILQIPHGADGTLTPITSTELDKDIKKLISYNLNSNPVSMVLKNTFEIYLPLPDRTIPLSGLIHEGSIFGTFRVLHPETSHQPQCNWNMTSGARSLFMLPKITESAKHLRIKKQFGLTVQKPMTLMAHWDVFRELANHADFPQKWDAEILFFSKQWFDHLDDEAWVEFYYYLLRTVWGSTEFVRNQPIWNTIFSLILQDYETRPSAYITDTVKYLMHVGIGAQPGFSPARNNLSAPISGLQQVYTNEYEIRNYPPIIMCPEKYQMSSNESFPVYYSLQFPTAIEFGKSSRARPSLISDLHDIRSLLMRYEREISSDKYHTDGTPIHELFQKTNFDYFHNNVELHSGMQNSKFMPEKDSGLLTTLDGVKYETFPDMCSFVKGCIRLSKK